MSKIFLETTAIVDLTFKKDKSADIKKVLSEHDQVISSQYARMEIKRGVLQYLVYLHNKVASYRSLADVLQSIQQLTSTPQRHRLATTLQAITEYFKTIADKTPADIIAKYGDKISLDEYLRRETLSYLRLVIKKVWYDIDKLTTQIINPMNCFLDIEPPILKGVMLVNKPSRCCDSLIECAIKKYIHDNEGEFKKILDELAKLDEPDDETKKRLRSLREIIRLLPYTSRSFSNKHNHQECWNCGDAILAVLSPSDSSVLTSNRRHYEPICTAICRNAIFY